MNIRQEFEAWAIDHGYDLDESKIFGRLYHCDESIRALQVWRAATSRQEAKIKALEQAIAQGQTPKILMVGANGHFKELSYEVAHDGNFLVRPSNFEQEHEIVRRCVTCKHFAIRNRDKCRSCDKDYCNWEPKI